MHIQSASTTKSRNLWLRWWERLSLPKWQNVQKITLNFLIIFFRKKGDNGKIIFAYIMGRAVRKKPEKFLNYLQKILFEIDDQRECNLIIDKAIFPLLKKKPHQYLDLMMNWIKQDNKYLSLSIQKLLVKLISFEPDMIKPIFHKLETSWLYASPNMINWIQVFWNQPIKLILISFFCLWKLPFNQESDLLQKFCVVQFAVIIKTLKNF